MTRPVLVLSLVAAASSASVADAREPGALNGDWVADLQTQTGLSRDVYLVADGIYSCESCSPPRSYPADGALRAVTGAPGVSESVTIAGPRAIVTRIIEPALNRVTTMTVAADDETATYVSIDQRPGVNVPLRTEYLARRVAAGPLGSHRVSGAWQGVRYVAVPEQVRTTRLRESGDRLSFSVPLGYHYTATYGGYFVPLQGPYEGGVAVAVRRETDGSIVETRKREGRVVQTRRYTPARDGRSLQIATTNVTTGVTFTVTARRAGDDR